MNTILKTIISLSFITLTVIIGYFVVGFLQLENKKADNLARYQCAQSAHYTVVDGNTTISYPPSNLYQKCLKEKGL